MTKDNLSPVGERIKARLRELKKTQGDLAEALQVSDNAVSKWIKFGTISRANAVRAAEFLRTTTDYLTGQEQKLPAKALHVAIDWNVLEEPLRSQIADMIHQQAAAARARLNSKHGLAEPTTAKRPAKARL